MNDWAPIGSFLFLFSLFQGFFWFLVFKVLIIMRSWHGFLWIYPFCDLLSFLNQEVCGFCQICEVFRHYFFKYFFQSTVFLLSFQDSDNTNIRSFVIAHCYWSSAHCFFSLFSLYCFDWVISDVSSSSLILFSVISNLLLSQSGKVLFFFFNFSYYVFQFYNIPFVLYIFFISLLRYLIFHLFQECLLLSDEVFLWLLL